MGLTRCSPSVRSPQEQKARLPETQEVAADLLQCWGVEDDLLAVLDNVESARYNLEFARDGIRAILASVRRAKKTPGDPHTLHGVRAMCDGLEENRDMIRNMKRTAKYIRDGCRLSGLCHGTGAENTACVGDATLHESHPVGDS